MTTSKTPSQADAITMSSGGLYSLATIGAKDVIDGAWPMLAEALEQMDLGASGPFVFADMGCADGGTSLDLVRSVIGHIRARSAGRDIQIVYTDQPRNDYNALVQIVHGLSGFKSYLDEFDNVFVSASGTSFYRQTLPGSSLDLGFSATAMHWLSRKPGNISNHVHAVGAQGAELAAFQEQAREDWRTILLNRARELTPGGHCVLVNFCRDEQGRYLGNTGGVNMFDTFNSLWRSFVDNGTITEAEYVDMTLPQHYKTVDEFRAPFDDPQSAVSQAGLRLEHIETRVIPCPFARDFLAHGDAAKFAAAYLPTLRTWNESTYFAALDTDRPLAERRAIIERYYAAYQSLVAAGPHGHAMDYVHAYLRMRKV